jgi:hypothetical protein
MNIVRRVSDAGKSIMPKKKDDKNALQLKDDPTLGRDASLARVALRPTVQAAATTQSFRLFTNETADFSALVDELGVQVSAVQNGELGRPEAMLVAQAHTLDAIFNHLARRAALNLGEYLGTVETYMKLAFKAQSQCRSTIEALSEIKNPRHVAFVKQANIAHNQQVNNGSPTDDAGTVVDGSRAEENEKKPNKLLEQNDGERLDTRTQSAASGVNSAMETVEGVNGAEDKARQTSR